MKFKVKKDRQRKVINKFSIIPTKIYIKEEQVIVWLEFYKVEKIYLIDCKWNSLFRNNGWKVLKKYK